MNFTAEDVRRIYEERNVLAAVQTPKNYGKNMTAPQMARQAGTQPRSPYIPPVASKNAPKNTALPKTGGGGARQPYIPPVAPKKTLSEYVVDGINAGKSGGYSVRYQAPNIGGVAKGIQDTAGYLGGKAKLGVLGFGEGLSDFVQPHMQNLSAGTMLASNVDPYMIAMQNADSKIKQNFRNSATKALTNSVTRDYANKLERKYMPTPQLRMAGDLVEAGTGMLPIMGLNAINPLLGKAALGMQAAGNATQDAYMDGATLEQAKLYGLAKGGTEVAIDSMSGGVPKLGKGIFSYPVMDKLESPIGRFLVDAGGEGGKGMLSVGIDPWLRRIIYKPNAANATAEELAKAGFMSAALSEIMQGGAAGINAVGNRGRSRG